MTHNTSSQNERVDGVPAITRRLVVTVSALGFVVEREWMNRLGYWSTQSRSFVDSFPLGIIAKLSSGAPHHIHIRHHATHDGKSVNA